MQNMCSSKSNYCFVLVQNQELKLDIFARPQELGQYLGAAFPDYLCSLNLIKVSGNKSTQKEP